jgi:hypothetical protein
MSYNCCQRFVEVDEASCDIPKTMKNIEKFEAKTRSMIFPFY